MLKSIAAVTARAVVLTVITATLLPASVSAARAGEPLETVKTAAEKAVQVLSDPKLQTKDKKQERIDRLREIISPMFDYDEMAKRALGPHWRNRTPAEQEEFSRLFRDFLERTYADKVDLFKGEKVIFGRETLDQDFAQAFGGGCVHRFPEDSRGIRGRRFYHAHCKKVTEALVAKGLFVRGHPECRTGATALGVLAAAPA